MSKVISVRDVSKRFRLGASRAKYRTLRESIAGAMPWNRSKEPAESQDLWALRGVNFEVNRGERVGIVGRNGAGKSTLLKLLSRISPPTGGEIDLEGRVSSLLEVGTGFHSELTGRENIFLNGAIMGMGRKEIQRKFDEIVAFSEVEKFLDTPVKRYSSGMYLKLGFAVASHLEPDILVVDEVLAVGDAAFQKKCLGKMDEVSKTGRTVLFVSHNMTAVKALCTRAILIDGGKVAEDGNVDSVVNRYLAAGSEMASTGIIPENAARHQDVKGEALFRSVRLTTNDDKPTSQLFFKQPFRVHVVCDVLKDIPDGHWEVSVSTADGLQVTYATSMDGGRGPRFIGKGRHEFAVDMENPLLPRGYTIDVGVHHQNGSTADFVQRTFDFTVERVAEAGDDHYPWPQSRGYMRPASRWTAAE